MRLRIVFNYYLLSGLFLFVSHCSNDSVDFRTDQNRDSSDDGTETGTDSDTDTDSDAETDSDAGADTVPDVSHDTDTDTDTDTDADTGPDCVRYVNNQLNAATKDGLTWATALPTVNEGISEASAALDKFPFCEVWVKSGHHIVTQGHIVKLLPNVHVYGSIAAQATSLKNRDFVKNETKLDGQRKVNHVVTGAADAVLDGFVVTGGNATGTGDNSNGGGMINSNGSTTLVENCTFKDNSANGFGGGMYNVESDVTIINCSFKGNDANSHGGGMYNSNCSPTVNNCVFRENHANNFTFGGGGMCNNVANPKITNSIFARNTAANSGAGIFNYNSEPHILHCTFAENTAGSNNGGGAIGSSAAMGLTYTVTVSNSILWGNQPQEIVSVGVGTAENYLTYSDRRGGGTANGNINQPPLFESSTLKLQSNSPCRDTANAVLAPKTDIEGNLRNDNFPDMGAYEYKEP